MRMRNQRCASTEAYDSLDGLERLEHPLHFLGDVLGVEPGGEVRERPPHVAVREPEDGGRPRREARDRD